MRVGFMCVRVFGFCCVVCVCFRYRLLAGFGFILSHQLRTTSFHDDHQFWLEIRLTDIWSLYTFRQMGNWQSRIVTIVCVQCLLGPIIREEPVDWPLTVCLREEHFTDWVEEKGLRIGVWFYGKCGFRLSPGKIADRWMGWVDDCHLTFGMSLAIKRQPLQ